MIKRLLKHLFRFFSRKKQAKLIKINMPKIPEVNEINGAVYEGFPVEKNNAVIDYISMLKSKHPHIKHERLKRKVAEHFHLKRIK